MVQTILFLILFNTSGCWSYGFKGCSQNFPKIHTMWCANKNIVNLSDVISMIPDNITTINLSKNNIRVIPPGSFSKLIRLKHLDLSQNKLVSLKGGEFRGLEALVSINLTSNNISSIHFGAFEGLTSLENLILSYNRLETMSPSVFHFLPVIKEVDLSLNRLKSYSCEEPGGSFTLTHLDLFANKIQRLNVSCFPALEYIKLSNNSNLELQADVFASNTRLKYLRLQAVEVEALVGLSAATKRNLSWVEFSLSLEKSRLTICGVLQGMDHLKKIHVHSVLLTQNSLCISLFINVFNLLTFSCDFCLIQVDLKGSRLPQSNSSLLDCATPLEIVIMDANLGNDSQLLLRKSKTKSLYLINCGLKQISHSTFYGFKGLKTLQLNENKIIIKQDTFKGLTHLKFLSFDKCKMRDIDPDWFIPLKNLNSLSFSKNEITELTTNVFSALSYLEELYLHFNLLKAITMNPFSKLWRLTKLNLSLNIIYYIEEGSFQDLHSLRYSVFSKCRFLFPLCQFTYCNVYFDPLDTWT